MDKSTEEYSLPELKAGFRELGDAFVCLACGYKAEKGVVYPEEGRFYEAWKHMTRHVERVHGSAFEALMALGRSASGLSETQEELVRLLYAGRSDADIQRELGIGSASTVRSHRFALREKERQARVFLALMELYRERSPVGRAQAKQGEKNEAGTELRRFFSDGTEGPLSRYPKKHKDRSQVLAVLAERFEAERFYSEKEVNALLEAAYEDYALLRRELVDNGWLKREADGSRYWRSPGDEGGEGVEVGVDVGAPTTKGGRSMNRRDELKQLAKETKTEAGVFRVTNKATGKLWIESVLNLKRMNGQEFALRMGTHMNKELQQDYNALGADAFEWEVLEKLQKKETGYFDEKEELRKLKLKWLKELRPYGETGYNSPKEEEH